MRLFGLSPAVWMPGAGFAAILLFVALSFVPPPGHGAPAEETATLTIEEDGIERTVEVDPVIHEVIEGVVNRAYAAEDELQAIQTVNAGALVERNRLRHETASCGERVKELEAQLSSVLAALDELEMRGE